MVFQLFSKIVDATRPTSRMPCKKINFYINGFVIVRIISFAFRLRIYLLRANIGGWLALVTTTCVLLFAFIAVVGFGWLARCCHIPFDACRTNTRLISMIIITMPSNLSTATKNTHIRHIFHMFHFVVSFGNLSPSGFRALLPPSVRSTSIPALPSAFY